MAEDYRQLVAQLTRLRGETLSRIDDLDKQIAALEQERESITAELAYVDGILRARAPELKLETVKPRRPKGSCVVKRADGRRVPVTQAILKLLRVRNVPMSVDDVVEVLSLDYPALDAEKLKQNVRSFLSTRRSKGVLEAAPNDKGVLAYRFAERTGTRLLMQAAE